MIPGRRRGFALAFVVAALAVQAAAAHPARQETIVVRFEPSYGLCAGLCPFFIMRVGPYGMVVTRQLQEPNLVWRVDHFGVTPAELVAFRRALEPLYPVRERRMHKLCRNKLSPGDPRPSDLSADNIEIRWISTGADARLTACEEAGRIRNTVYGALDALGVSVAGTRARSLR